MSEIEFRVWDEVAEEYIFWELNEKSNYLWEKSRDNGLTPEQYTGEKDNNKKKCFFGDIVSNGKWKAEVIHHETGGMGLKGNNGFISRLDIRNIPWLKIIGNINEPT